MQIVDEITVKHASYWSDFYESGVVEFAPPPDLSDCAACSAVVTRTEDGEQVIRVPWVPDKADLMNLVTGGTVWLSTWGALPPHFLEVQPA